MGPTAGLILADLGADVIKIEPVAGDHTRRLYGFAAGFFPTFNRNKRSLAIDLKSEEGRALLHRLAGTADVVLENYAPGTMERLGCGYADLAAKNPRLIYCALKGFLSGPYEHRPALDEVVQFMAGLAYMTGPPGQPLRAGASVVDIMGGMFAVIGIQAALRERERTGRGQAIKSALFESTAFLMMSHMAGEVVTGKPMPPMPSRDGAWAIYEPFPRPTASRFLSASPATANGAASARISAGRICWTTRPTRPTRIACARGRCSARWSPTSSPGISLPSLPNCSTASIFRLRLSPNPATCSMIRSSMPAAACWTSHSGTASTPSCRGCRSRWASTISPCAGRRRASASIRRDSRRARACARTRSADLIKRGVVASRRSLMSDLPAAVHITEEGPREGFQIEKGPIPTARKIELIDALAQTGLERIQIVSFVNPKNVPGMADAEDVVRGIAPQAGRRLHGAVAQRERFRAGA